MKNSKGKSQNYLLLAILLGLLILPLVSLAQGLVPCGPGTGTPCQLCHFFVLFKNIIDYLLTRIVPVVAVLMIVIGGFMYVFAYLGAIPGDAGAGGPALLSRAKSLFTYTIVGLVVIYASWLIINLFFQVIGVADWTGLREGWWQINCPAPVINAPSQQLQQTVQVLNSLLISRGYAGILTQDSTVDAPPFIDINDPQNFAYVAGCMARVAIAKAEANIDIPEALVHAKKAEQYAKEAQEAADRGDLERARDRAGATLSEAITVDRILGGEAIGPIC